MSVSAPLSARRPQRLLPTARDIPRLFAMALVWLAALACAYPPLYIFYESLLSPSRGRFHRPAVLGYVSVFEDPRLWVALKNTTIAEVIVLTTTLFFCPLAGYAFAKFQFRGKRVFFGIMILTLFFVPLAELIPLLLEMNQFGWINTYQGLVAPQAISSLGIFWMTVVIRGIPDELLHAARLDGCGSFSTWWRIVLPLIQPSLLALALIMFVTEYGDYLWPLLIMITDDMQTMQLFLGGGGGPYGGGGGSPATIVISMLPGIIAFLIVQRYYFADMFKRNRPFTIALEDEFPFQGDGFAGALDTTDSGVGARRDDVASAPLPDSPILARALALAGLRPWLSARTGTIVQCAVIAGWTFLVYLNALHNRFQLDDLYRVVGNPGVEHLWPIWRHFTDPTTSAFLPSLAQFRPLLPLSLAINHALTGDSLVGYHLGNLLLALTSSLIIYFLVRELLGCWTAPRIPTYWVDFLAMVVALVTAIHPVSALLVSYISGRDLLLMQCFLGSMLLLYARMQRLSLSADRDEPRLASPVERVLRRWFGGSSVGWVAVLVLFELAMLSKTQAIAGCALILAFEVTLGRGGFSRFATYARTLPFVLIAIGHIFYIDWYLNFAALPDSPNIPADAVWTYPLTQARLSVLHYLPNLAWPFNMHMVSVEPIVNNPQDGGVLFGLALIIGTLIVAGLLRRRSPLAAFCILGYWIAQSPESSVTPMLHNVVDYRPYPAIPFLFLGLAIVLNRYLKPIVASGVLILLVVFFSVASVHVNSMW